MMNKLQEEESDRRMDAEIQIKELEQKMDEELMVRAVKDRAEIEKTLKDKQSKEKVQMLDYLLGDNKDNEAIR